MKNENYSNIDIDIDEEMEQLILRSFFKRSFSGASLSLLNDNETITLEKIGEIVMNEEIINILRDQIIDLEEEEELNLADDGC